MNQSETPENYVKILKGKNHGAERENSLNQRDKNEFSMLYYKFDSLGFDPLLRRKRSIFAAEG